MPISPAFVARIERSEVRELPPGCLTRSIRATLADDDDLNAISFERPHPEEGAFAPVSKDVATWFETRSKRSAPHHEGWRMCVADGDNSGNV
jgi:hypothetical protein